MTFRCVSRLQQEPLATPRNTHTQTGRSTWGGKRWGETGREKTTGNKKKKPTTTWCLSTHCDTEGLPKTCRT